MGNMTGPGAVHVPGLLKKVSVSTPPQSAQAKGGTATPKKGFGAAPKPTPGKRGGGGTGGNKR